MSNKGEPRTVYGSYSTIYTFADPLTVRVWMVEKGGAIVEITDDVRRISRGFNEAMDRGDLEVLRGDPDQ